MKSKTIDEEAKAEFRPFQVRKDAAAYFQTCTHTPILFRMLDDRDYAEIIWKMIYPEHAKAFHEIGEGPNPDHL